MKIRLRYTILLLDLAWITLAFTLSYALRYGRVVFDAGLWPSLGGYAPVIAAAALIWTFLFLSKDLEGFKGGWHLPTVFSQVMVGVFYLMVFLFALAFLGRHYYSRLLLLYLACFLPFGLIIIRCFARWMLLSPGRRAARRTVILGGGHLARELASKIARHPELLLEVVGLLYPSGSDPANGFAASHSELISVRSLNVLTLLQEQRIEEVIVVMPQPAGLEVEKLISKCREANMSVRLVPHWYELYVTDAQLTEIDGVPLISLEERNISPLALGLKRGVDLIGGILLLLVSSPFLLVSIATLRRQKGEALTKEVRCGMAGKRFHMLRLNVDRADSNWSRFEKLLLKFSLTELPQIWNVLRGEMSLVGPRPESPERVKHYSDWQRQRLSVQPGLTGLAQVHGLREQHSSEEKARFDLQYIFHWSLFLDFSLVVQTAWTLLVRFLKSPYFKSARVPVGAKHIERTSGEVLHVDRSQSSAD
jgi:lipopolysaccharide/colanic/teichoic acid biosynthesis glycosyltransferase